MDKPLNDRHNQWSCQSPHQNVEKSQRRLLETHEENSPTCLTSDSSFQRPETLSHEPLEIRFSCPHAVWLGHTRPLQRPTRATEETSSSKSCCDSTSKVVHVSCSRLSTTDNGAKKKDVTASQCVAHLIVSLLFKKTNMCQI